MSRKRKITFCVCDITCNFLSICMIASSFLVITGITMGSEGQNSKPYYNDSSRRIFKRQTCEFRQFTCKSGQCISSLLICDGKPDCDDRSDEIQATCPWSNSCIRGSYRCAYGACIDMAKKCDGVQDCADNSDELLLECPNFKWTSAVNTCGRKFQCRSGKCIDDYLTCDGRADCEDGSDETVTHCNNPAIRCPPKTVRCAYGACIELSQQCDGQKHCADGSDEDPFLCNYTVPSTTTTTTTTTPSTTNGVSSINGCKVPESLPGTNFILKGDILEMICEKNYAPIKGYSDRQNFFFCNPTTSKWDRPDMKCLPRCKPLKSVSVNYRCTYDGSDDDPMSNCTSHMRYGTIANAECAAEYQLISGFQYSQNTCEMNGRWTYGMSTFVCEATCGIRYLGNAIIPQIAHGNNVSNVSEFPWNAALYYRNATSNLWDHSCGGTILSAYVVLTAAHCFYSLSDKRNPLSSYKIVVGKYFREFEKEEEHAKMMDVADVLIPRQYKNKRGNYEFDVALIELATPIIFHKIIKPACIRYQQQHSLVTKVGFVAGWGRDESGKSTDELKWAQMKYFTKENCLERISSNHRDLVKDDKFCAYADNKTKVLQGDSGAGLTFPFMIGDPPEEKHYVYGIVSVNIDNVSWFTDLTNNFIKSFVEDSMRAIERKLLREQ